MAFHSDIEVTTASQIPAKIVPLQFLFSGTRLDLGEGVVSIASIGRAEDGTEYPLKSSCPQANVSCSVQSILGKTYAGIPAESVLAALGALADEMYAAAGGN